MYSCLRIDDDPTTWLLNEPIDAARLTESSEPLAIAVGYPLTGTLLLSCRAAASIVLLPREIRPPRGWIPTDDALPGQLYLPRSAAPGDSAPLYTLPGSVDPAELERRIKSAMLVGGFGSIDIVDAAGNGVVIINGEILPFAVICPARV